MQFRANEIIEELTEEQIRSALPSQVHSMLEVVSVATAMKIIEVYGGVRLYVPLDYPPNHEMTTLIGPEQAAALSKSYGAMDHFDIPLCRDVVRLLRNTRILRLFGQGASYRELALKFGVSERMISKLISQNPSARKYRKPTMRRVTRCIDSRATERKKEIRELWRNGVTVKEIAKKLHVHQTTVYGAVSDLREKQDRVERNKAIAQLSASGMSVASLAVQFKLDKSTIRKIAARQ